MPFNPTAANIARMKVLLDLQWVKRRIAEYLGCSTRTVQTWKKRLAEENNGGPAARDGRKRNPSYKLSDGVLQLVMEYMLSHPFMHLQEVINDLQLNCNCKTLSRWIIKILLYIQFNIYFM